VSSVLVTHADEPIGRRVVKTLFHDGGVDRILALGGGAAPHGFDAFLARSGPRLTYTRIDLAKHRAMTDFFHSQRFRSAEVDTVVYIPHHGAAAAGRPIPGGLSERTAEARLLLQNCLDSSSVRNLVAVGSAFVYRLAPGNANHLAEDSELDLDPDVAPEIRSWIDCDMIFHGEVHSNRLRVVLLRVPTVVTGGGYVYLNPSLAGRPGARLRAAGFDPICALVSDKDVACGVRAAVKAERSGIYNIAGAEAVPLSILARWTGRPTVPIPGPLLRWIAAGERVTGTDFARAAAEGPHLLYGFTLDTHSAERDLGFRSAYRIGRARAGDGSFILETPPH